MAGGRPLSALPGIMSNIEVRVARAINITVQEVTRIAHATAIRTTPVDTGLARSNWVVTIGTPFVGVIPPYAPGMKRGIGERANASRARKQGLDTIRRWRVENENVALFITNNTPYIGYLNDGSPTTNPPKQMLQKAVMAGTAAVGRTFRRSFKATRIDRTVV